VVPAARAHPVDGSPLTDIELAALPIAYGTALGMLERGGVTEGADGPGSPGPPAGWDWPSSRWLTPGALESSGSAAGTSRWRFAAQGLTPSSTEARAG